MWRVATLPGWLHWPGRRPTGNTETIDPLMAAAPPANWGES